MGTATKTEIPINPTLIKSFMQSTKNVLSTMMSVETKCGTPLLKDKPQPSYDVSGIIGFSGEVVGSVVISFKMESAIKLVEALAGEVLEPDDPDFADAIGEMSNMIAGNAKKDFGLDANISIPSVIIGSGHTVARLRNVPCVVIPCTSNVGEFAVEINIKQVK